MRVTCPGCHAELSLEVLLTHEAARHAVARLAAVSLPFGALTLRYMALFRPEKRGLSIERMVRLVEELVVDVERQSITRKGREWHADVETWRAAIDEVISKREKGTLRLPLTNHALLHEVICGLVERHEARAESQREADRRGRREAGPRTQGPRNLGDMALDLAAGPDSEPGSLSPALGSATVVITSKPAPASAYSGPSRAALALRAQIAAAQAARGGMPAAPTAPTAPPPPTEEDPQ